MFQLQRYFFYASLLPWFILGSPSVHPRFTLGLLALPRWPSSVTDGDALNHIVGNPAIPAVNEKRGKQRPQSPSLKVYPERTGTKPHLRISCLRWHGLGSQIEPHP